MFNNCEILTFIGEQYNERLRLNSRVYLLNVDIDCSRTSLIRLIGVLNSVFNRMIEEIHNVVPCNCWVRIYFLRDFPVENLVIQLYWWMILMLKCCWIHYPEICKVMVLFN